MSDDYEQHKWLNIELKSAKFALYFCKNVTLMNWNDLRVFLALARAGSVRASAVRLTVSHSTVVRRIEALEASLGVRLFERLAMGYTLTPAGEAMLQRAEKIEDEIHGLELSILGQDAKLSGAIRVTMADALFQHLLAPDLQRFKLAYPDIDIEITASYDVVDLSKREADVAIRFMSNPPEHLVGHRLPNLNVSFYASHEYLKRHNLTADPPTANWIGMDEITAFPTNQWLKNSPLSSYSGSVGFTDVFTAYCCTGRTRDGNVALL